jgi:hypothetical protein
MEPWMEPFARTIDAARKYGLSGSLAGLHLSGGRLTARVPCLHHGRPQRNQRDSSGNGRDPCTGVHGRHRYSRRATPVGGSAFVPDRIGIHEESPSSGRTGCQPGVAHRAQGDGRPSTDLPGS